MVLPAREVADTIGAIVERLRALDRWSTRCWSWTPARATAPPRSRPRAGAEVYQEDELLPEFGPVLGKGDAMWRALSVVARRPRGLPRRRHARLRAALRRSACSARCLRRRTSSSSRASTAGRSGRGRDGSPAGGGRVTELTARPLLPAFYPELAGVRQPLAGEVAARRELLERIPFATGYAVETAMLIDVRDAARRHRRHGAGRPRRSAATTTSRCATSGPMALRGAARDPRAAAREGRLLDDHGAPAPDRRRPARAGRDRGAPAVRHAPRPRVVALRCVYTDLDGTLLGKGASLFRTARATSRCSRRARWRPATAPAWRS